MQVKDSGKDRVENAVGAVRVGSILIAAGITIFVPALEALTEVVVVVSLVDVVSVIAVVCVLIGVGVLVVGAPAVFAVRLSCQKSLLIAIVDALAKQVCSVLIHLVVAAAAQITIAGSGVVSGIVVVVAVALILQCCLLLT